MIIDTHAHYDDKAFDEDRDTLLVGMQQAGIGRIVKPSHISDASVVVGFENYLSKAKHRT